MDALTKPLGTVLASALLLLLGCATLQAAPRATATLSQTTLSVGDAATLTIEVTGARQLTPPTEIAVDGLEIRYGGYQQNTQIYNGQINRSVAITFSVEPQRAGVFTIPPTEVQTDAGAIRTEPLQITVRAAPPGSAPADGTRNVFAEIEVPRKTVYLGEMVPVEVRLFVDRKIRWRIEEMPELEGDGFTKVRFPRPREELARRDGREYDVLTFRTAISPSKAGKIALGPMELRFLASIPRARPNRRASPFDMFDDAFFNDPFGAFGATERRKVAAPAIELEVLPLPAADRPSDFSGAVGQFEMAVEAGPARVKIGDPVTVKVNITGKGNFDRVTAPALANDQGWRVYPSTGTFTPQDDLAASGQKSFEIAVVPETKQTEMPQMRFSYFDPVEKKYVTRLSPPAPLTVEGTPPPPAVTRAAEPKEAAPAPPDAPPVPQDILGIKYEPGPVRTSFVPIYRTQAFWVAQSVPALGFLGLVGLRLFRKNERKHVTSRLLREYQRHSKALAQETDYRRYFETAARLVQVETALAAGCDEHTVDAATVRRAALADEATLAGVDAIFAKRAEALYAGVGGGEQRLAAADRDLVSRTLDQLKRGRRNA